MPTRVFFPESFDGDIAIKPRKNTNSSTALDEVETGDALPDRRPENKKEQGTGRHKRAATARPERVWDYAVIPYEIDANVSGVHKALFKQVRRMNAEAFKHISDTLIVTGRQ